MKYLLTITVEGETSNAWAETEGQGRVLLNMLKDVPGIQRVLLHKTSQRGPHRLLVDYAKQPEVRR